MKDEAPAHGDEFMPGSPLQNVDWRSWGDSIARDVSGKAAERHTGKPAKDEVDGAHYVYRSEPRLLFGAASWRSATWNRILIG